MGDIFFVSALTHEADVEFYGLGDGFQTDALVVAWMVDRSSALKSMAEKR